LWAACWRRCRWFPFTKDVGKIAALSTSIFWLVLPSLAFFLALPPLLLKLRLNFSLGFGLATALMLLCYVIMLAVLERFGVSL
jgi:hypothetical protein